MATPSALLLLLLLPLFLSTAAGTSVPSEELRALLDFVGGLVADEGWAELHPLPCTETPWPGIQCETAAGDTDRLHVASIHVGPDVASFPPCKSSATLHPEGLLHLPFLKTLSLFSCFLSPNSVSLPPSLFTSSSSLEQLVLDSNTGLSGKIPSSISNLTRLRVLCLSQNAFHGVIPPEFGHLLSLQELDLSYNHLTGQMPEEIGSLLNLGIIDLSSNELQGTIPASLSTLHSLQKLDLSFNSLCGTVPPELGELKRLVLLDLSHNNLTGPLPETLAGLNELEYFLMENNPLNTGIPIFLADLKKLQAVGLSRCGLTGPIPSLTSLVSLAALSLDRNKLNGTVPRSLESLPKLGQLNLSKNQLSGEITFSEQFMMRLGKRLDLRDNTGLCTMLNTTFHHEASFNLEAPPCLGGNRGVIEAAVLDKDPPLNGNGGAGFIRHLRFQGFAMVISALLA
ncbi:hypothetical protein KSP40_PGU010613 [Platanthera guangdongensis]|uniref:Piriformospora indica-insensitive protein 2 n=1 Tax=Platanthera guangdongensis TaxID=2320717 RepID=A0ABR2LYD2_9ASPA